MMAPGLVAGPSSGPNSPDASVPALELDLGLMGMGLGSHTAGGRR